MLVLARCLAKKNKAMLIQNMMIFLYSFLSGDIKKLLAAAAAHIHTFTHARYKK